MFMDCDTNYLFEIVILDCSPRELLARDFGHGRAQL